MPFSSVKIEFEPLHIPLPCILVLTLMHHGITPPSTMKSWYPKLQQYGLMNSDNSLTGNGHGLAIYLQNYHKVVDLSYGDNIGILHYLAHESLEADLKALEPHVTYSPVLSFKIGQIVTEKIEAYCRVFGLTAIGNTNSEALDKLNTLRTEELKEIWGYS